MESSFRLESLVNNGDVTWKSLDIANKKDLGSNLYLGTAGHATFTSRLNSVPFGDIPVGFRIATDAVTGQPVDFQYDQQYQRYTT